MVLMLPKLKALLIKNKRFIMAVKINSREIRLYIFGEIGYARKFRVEIAVIFIYAISVLFAFLCEII